METSSSTSLHDLIPLNPREVAGATIQTANARQLHAALGVGRDYSTWIKARIDQYGFVEDQDYVREALDSIDPQNGGTGKLRVFDGANPLVNLPLPVQVQTWAMTP